MSGARVSGRRARRAGAASAGLAILLVAALGGCGRGSLTSDTATASVTPVPVTAPPTAAATITISGFAFSAPVTVPPGQVVSVVNYDPVPHTVTAQNPRDFDAHVDPNGRTFLTAPSAPGTYPFTCTIHPMMHGTLIVR